MPLSRRESLQSESERSHLFPRVEARNRTRFAGAIHAHSSRRETNRATETRSIGGIRARAAEGYSALTTHHCLLRGVISGADFIQAGNGGGRLLLSTGTRAAAHGIVVRGKLALSNGGRDEPEFLYHGE